MKKIMFNDRYGLTKAVLSGRKTQTRRIITCPKTFKGQDVCGFNVYIRQSDGSIPFWPCTYDADEATIDGGEILPKYKVGEIVAVAQSYKDAGYSFCMSQAAYLNKMFTKTEYMPHQIRITNVRMERLQEISNEDCIKEGIYKDEYNTCFNGYAFEISKDQHGNVLAKKWHKTPREAFATLIDRISGKGTWESNPWVFVYDFELVK